MTERAMAGLVRDGVLDAELAALLSLLLEVRTPVVVIGSDAPARDGVLAALVASLPPSARATPVAPEDDFEWLREAVELGWRRERAPVRPVARDAISSADGVLVARGLGAIGGVAGERARIVVRALALGYGLIATMDGDGLDDVLATLDDPAIGTDDHERSRLGIVLALAGDPGSSRVGAAHYVRPVALDTHGHVQRQAPAVLATWNDRTAAWDHFAWGLMAELGDRTGRAALDLEREQARRATALAEAARPDV